MIYGYLIIQSDSQIVIVNCKVVYSIDSWLAADLRQSMFQQVRLCPAVLSCRWIQFHWQASLAAESDSASNALAHTTGSFMTADDPQQFVRVQRVRSKKASSWMEKPETLPNLIISATMLSPLERMMRSAQTDEVCDLGPVLSSSTVTSCLLTCCDMLMFFASWLP